MSNCAVTRPAGGGETCLSREELIDFAKSYNHLHSDQINLKQNKSGLYNDLRKKFSCTIDGDACLLEELGLERDKILKPRQPDGAYAWLSTIVLNDVRDLFCWGTFRSTKGKAPRLFLLAQNRAFKALS